MANYSAKYVNTTFNMFFDRPGVMNKIHEGESKLFNRVGGYARRVIKTSMRPGGKKQKTSSPGEPPRAQTGLLKKFIFYNYDKSTHSVVIGPMVLNRRGSTGEVPRVLEFGGTATGSVIKKVIHNNGRPKIIRQTFKYKMQPRPYVGERSRNYPKVIAEWQKQLKDFVKD